MRESPCPRCHNVVKHTETVSIPPALPLPKVGDLAICGKCATIMIIGEDECLRFLRPREFIAVQNKPQLVELLGHVQRSIVHNIQQKALLN